MARVLIIGASRGIGLETVKAALEAGYSVRALARSARRIPVSHPIGRHRYFHKLYALDITLNLRDATKSQIERAMQGHILANAELIGTYQKGGR